MYRKMVYGREGLEAATVRTYLTTTVRMKYPNSRPTRIDKVIPRCTRRSGELSTLHKIQS